jgi:hypothetical protein
MKTDQNVKYFFEYDTIFSLRVTIGFIHTNFLKHHTYNHIQ